MTMTMPARSLVKGGGEYERGVVLEVVLTRFATLNLQMRREATMETTPDKQRRSRR